MTTPNVYPDDGSAPTKLSADLTNVPVAESDVAHTDFLKDTDGFGYDIFTGRHWGNNVIESNPSGDPSYKGQYFYSGAYIGGKFLLQPTINGGSQAPRLASLTPDRIDVALNAKDPTMYDVTAHYTIGSGQKLPEGTSYTYGPAGVQWENVPSSLQGNQAAAASAIAQNNLVPTKVKLLSQFQTPDHNNMTLVEGTVPGSASSALTGVPDFTLASNRRGANFLVTSKPLGSSAYTSLSRLMEDIQKSPDVSKAAKAWLASSATVPTPTNWGGVETNLLFGNILVYGLVETFSGKYLNPTSTAGWDGGSANLHGLYTDGNSNFSADDLRGIIKAIHDDPSIGIPSYRYACFLPGTLIRTPQGDCPVECLREGSHVLAWMGKDKVEEKTVLKVIKRNAEVQPEKEDDNAGWPICIKANAFASGVPSADLSVTSEHCFYFSGAFVPVRMLVNGISIFYDRSQKFYEYFHVRLDPHCVIWANNTRTESWLDTETLIACRDRHTGQAVLRKRNWQEDAAFPLNVSADFVKTLYDHCIMRCRKDGLLPQDKRTVKDEVRQSNIHIQLKNGEKVFPLRWVGKEAVFSLPPLLSNEIYLCSSTFRPVDAYGPFVDDRRELGVLIGTIHLWFGANCERLDSHLEMAFLEGWDVQEQGAHRWTKGRARLQLPEKIINIGNYVKFLLSVEVKKEGIYKVNHEFNSNIREPSMV